MIKMKEYRINLGLTQRQLSEISGVQYRTIQELEADRIMHINTTQAIFVYKLSKALGCTMEDLLELDE